MSDQYEQIRSLPFPALAAELGISMERYKTRKGGKEWYGPCPVHKAQNNTTSFSFNADGRFQCFSCNAKGRGAIDLTKLILNLGFKEAVERLSAVKVSPVTKKEPVEAPVNGSVELKPFDGATYRKFAQPCPWLEARVPDPAIREKYGVFMYNNLARKSAYSGRIMLPIKDVAGVLYGYLGRSIADSYQTHIEAKYLFPKDFPKSRFAFGAAELKAGGLPLPLKLLYVAESPWTVMKFASMGLPCISLYGWSASLEQIEIMAGLTRAVCFLPDRNKSGQESAGVVQAIARRLYVHAPELPSGIDDPEYLNKLQVLAL